jgi:hypothetical protein
VLLTVWDAAQDDLLRLPRGWYLKADSHHFTQGWVGVRDVIACARMHNLSDPFRGLLLKDRGLFDFHNR